MVSARPGTTEEQARRIIAPGGGRNAGTNEAILERVRREFGGNAKVAEGATAAGRIA